MIATAFTPGEGGTLINLACVEQVIDLTPDAKEPADKCVEIHMSSGKILNVAGFAANNLIGQAVTCKQQFDAMIAIAMNGGKRIVSPGIH